MYSRWTLENTKWESRWEEKNRETFQKKSVDDVKEDQHCPRGRQMCIRDRSDNVRFMKWIPQQDLLGKY